jgi:hypothetical protein
VVDLRQSVSERNDPESCIETFAGKHVKAIPTIVPPLFMAGREFIAT